MFLHSSAHVSELGESTIQSSFWMELLMHKTKKQNLFLCPNPSGNTGSRRHAVTAKNIHLVVDVDGSSNLPVATRHWLQPLAIMVTSSCIWVLVVELQSTLRQQSLSWWGKQKETLLKRNKNSRRKKNSSCRAESKVVDQTALSLEYNSVTKTQWHVDGTGLIYQINLINTLHPPDI